MRVCARVCLRLRVRVCAWAGGGGGGGGGGQAKASMIWIIGEYAGRIENADELLTRCVPCLLPCCIERGVCLCACVRARGVEVLC